MTGVQIDLWGTYPKFDLKGKRDATSCSIAALIVGNKTNLITSPTDGETFRSPFHKIYDRGNGKYLFLGTKGTYHAMNAYLHGGIIIEHMKMWTMGLDKYPDSSDLCSTWLVNLDDPQAKRWPDDDETSTLDGAKISKLNKISEGSKRMSKPIGDTAAKDRQGNETPKMANAAQPIPQIIAPGLANPLNPNSSTFFPPQTMPPVPLFIPGPQNMNQSSLSMQYGQHTATASSYAGTGPYGMAASYITGSNSYAASSLSTIQVPGSMNGLIDRAQLQSIINSIV